jgi:hypothetical protein
MFKGNDYTIEFAVTDSNSNVIDLTGISEIIVYVIDRKNTLVAKYKYPNTTGYKNITINDAVNGKFQIKLEETDLNNASAGLIFGEVKLVWSDSSFSDGDRKESDKVLIDELKEISLQNE